MDVQEMSPAQAKGYRSAGNLVLPYCPFRQGTPERLQWLSGFAARVSAELDAETEAQRPAAPPTSEAEDEGGAAAASPQSVGDAQD